MAKSDRESEVSDNEEGKEAAATSKDKKKRDVLCGQAGM